MNSIDEIKEKYTKMQTLQAEARKNGSPSKVFDWDKAARIIKERNPEKAAAGLSEDWFWTGAVIWNDGKISDEWKPYLKSYWATPVIVLESALDWEEIECWIPAEETEWDENTHWPESARKILLGEVAE